MNPGHHHGVELERIGEATTHGVLYSVGSAFPALVEGEGEGEVHGVVWESPDPLTHALALSMFDAIEGYNPANVEASMYVRERRMTSLGEAWCYVWNQDLWRLNRIPSGRWARAVL
jgi:gamma-glutamylcyclotransferase (GGCT)/AIG2-like uncharacterized protein YtfP